MIKKFIDRLLGKTRWRPRRRTAGQARRDRRGRARHRPEPARRAARCAWCARLKDAGHEAYIVGGAVRDLLVGLRPKDFDVATDATPEQVKALFRRAFIIGRRFRIVHVIFGRGREHEVIEVSTFRALLDSAAADQVSGNEKTSKQELSGKTHVVDASGRVLRDNVWGPQIEDAARRDFTVNALYYDPTEQLVVDYHHGFKDAQEARAAHDRRPGDALPRRPGAHHPRGALRRQARLRHRPEDAGADQGDGRAAGQRAGVAPVRRDDQAAADRACTEEPGRTAQAGPGSRCLPDPRCGAATWAARKDERDRFVQLALADTDRRVGEGRPVAPSFMLACMLWHEVLERWVGVQVEGRGRRSRRCSRRSMRSSTRASATSPAAASWPPTCARSG